MNNGLLITPGADEQWTLSIAHTDEELDRYVSFFEEFARGRHSRIRAAEGSGPHSLPVRGGRGWERSLVVLRHTLGEKVTNAKCISEALDCNAFLFATRDGGRLATNRIPRRSREPLQCKGSRP